MDAASLPAALELTASGGAGLSPEKRAVLGSSLLLLQRDYRFDRVWFWGCIQGVRGAYYIAEGLGPDRAAPRSRLYRCGVGPGLTAAPCRGRAAPWERLGPGGPIWELVGEERGLGSQGRLPSSPGGGFSVP